MQSWLNGDGTAVAAAPAAGLLERAREAFVQRPFVPHPLLVPGDVQTIVAHFWPGRRTAEDGSPPQDRLFRVDARTRVLARCHWHRRRADRPTLLLCHGIAGSADSAYMVGTADKAYRAGFNVVRVNARNCGNTEHLSPTLSHGGLAADLRAIIGELVAADGLDRLFVAGFSLGGNLVLKLAGEYGASPPRELRGVCAVSAPLDLGACAAVLRRPRNRLYHNHFLRELRRGILAKERFFPDGFRAGDLQSVHSIEDFDERYTAPSFGFRSAGDYYASSSALPLLDCVRVPSLIIQAADDPIIPLLPELEGAAARNPLLLLVVTERGGHVGFVSGDTGDEDRFWVENRVVEFCCLGAAC